MATELQVQLKQAVTGVVFSIGENDIINVVGEGTGSKVTFFDEGARVRIETVVEAPEDIKDLTKVLIPVTDTSSGLTEFINSGRIILVDSKGTGSVIKYNAEGSIAKQLEVDESKGAIQVLVFELTGNTAYTIDLLSNGPEVIRLSAGDGDVAAQFTVGKILSIVGQGDSNGTYTVVSSVFGGGKTSITVTEVIPELTVAGNVINVN